MGVSFICWLWFTDNCVRPTRVPGRLIEFPLYCHSTKRFHMSKGTNLKWSFMSPTTRHTDDHKSICRPHFLRACKHCLSQQRLVADFPKPEWSGYLSFTRREEDIFLFEFWFACPWGLIVKLLALGSAEFGFREQFKWSIRFTWRLKNYSEQRRESFSVMHEFEVKLRPLLWPKST